MMNKPILVINQVDDGLQAECSLNDANLDIVIAFIKMLDKIRNSLTEEMMTRLGQSHIENEENGEELLKELTDTFTRIDKMMKDATNNEKKQLVKDLIGSLNNLSKGG